MLFPVFPEAGEHVSVFPIVPVDDGVEIHEIGIVSVFQKNGAYGILFLVPGSFQDSCFCLQKIFMPFLRIAHKKSPAMVLVSSMLVRMILLSVMLPLSDVHGCMIRDNENHQIDNALASGSWEGQIFWETAVYYSEKPELLKRQMQ